MKKRVHPPCVRCGLAFSLALALCLVFSEPSSARYRYTLTPGLSVGIAYEDNLGLDDENPRSDWVTTVTPSFGLGVTSPRTGLNLQYRPTYVRYQKYHEDDTFRHYLNLNAWHAFSKYLRVEFTDSYLKTDDPFEEEAPQEDFLHERESYETNHAQIKMDYQFGPRNAVFGGYHHRFARYEGFGSTDTTEHGPFAGMTYWFDLQNGMDMGYDYTRYEFEENEAGVRDEPIDAHGIRLGYIRRFSPHTQGFLRYGLSIRDSNDAQEDYMVHQGSVGLAHSFSKTLKLDAHAGGFQRSGSTGDDGTGLLYGVQVAKTLQHGSLSVNTERGWDEGYLEEDQRGFTQYWTAGMNFRHELTDELGFYSRLSYRLNDEEDDAADDTTYQGSTGLNWNFHRDYALGLDYRYRKRVSDDPGEEYTSNRIMLSLSWRRAFHWPR